MTIEAARLRALLHDSVLFSELTAEGLDRVAAITAVRSLAAGRALFHQGDPGNEMYIVAEGAVRITVRSAEGKEILLCRLGPGDELGEISLLDSGPRTATVTSESATTLIVVSRDALLPLLRGEPEVGIQMLTNLARRLRETDILITDTLAFDIPARLAKTLLGLAKAYGQYLRDEVRIDAGFSLQELARIAGLPVGKVEAQLGDWEREGLIKARGDTIRIKDIAELEALL